MLKMLMFCHRHQKNDSYLEHTPVDFSIVREPMYKYSRLAQDRFFQLPEFAFLFAIFAQTRDAQLFADNKFFENTDARFAPRMRTEI